MEHGTLQAYNWHRSRKVPKCDACKAFWREYMSTRKTPARTAPREINPDNAEVKKFDAVLTENPPRIQRQKNKHGIYKAVNVRDPHKDRDPRGAVRTYEPLPPDTCEPMTPAAALIALQEEAREVAARFEQHRADNTPLMAAARKEI